MIAFKILSIFGNTYICEQLFSNINFIKNELGTQMNNVCIDTRFKLLPIFKCSPKYLISQISCFIFCVCARVRKCVCVCVYIILFN